jgi:threonylcarbamoyladenosine tRNA methylthiotransferase MtaB
MTQSFSLHSIGCRLNQYEVAALAAKLESLGFQQVAFGEPADLTVINTCTVTGRADADARNAIRRARRLSPHAKIVVTGCYAQAQPDEVDALEQVDLRVDNLQKDRLLARLVETFGYAVPFGVDFDHLNSPDFAVSSFGRHTRAMVKIQDGCQEACSYCIIPRARGHERSRSPESILTEVNALAQNGYKEVVLSGVHVGKYRYGATRLVDLLQLILNRSPLAQIRLTSMEPREFRRDLVDLLVSESRLCAHLHIPVQAGQDDILRAMRRSYDTRFVTDLFERLVAARPDLAIGTDVITGFPGEREEQFAATEAFLRSLPVAYLHVFSYSDRPGTEAAGRTDKVSPETIRSRTQRLRELSRELRRAFVSRYIGKTVPVLIERRRDRQSGLLVGMSGNYMRVLTEGSDALQNEIVPVRIERLTDEMAHGVAA